MCKVVVIELSTTELVWNLDSVKIFCIFLSKQTHLNHTEGITDETILILVEKIISSPPPPRCKRAI